MKLALSLPSSLQWGFGAPISKGKKNSILLNRSVTESPKYLHDKHAQKARLWSCASKICTIALVAIFAAAAFSICLAPELTAVATIGACICALPLHAGALFFNTQASIHQNRAATEQAIKIELQTIIHWKREEIEQFFKDHDLCLDLLPIEALRSIHPEEPLCALLPAIARYRYLKTRALHFYDQYRMNCFNQIQDPTVKMFEIRHGWTLLEEYAIPAALAATIQLQIISNPTLQIKLDDLGHIVSKSFEQRCADKIFHQTDEFFRFKDARPSLDLSALLDALSNHQFCKIRQMLFIDSCLELKPKQQQPEEWEMAHEALPSKS